MAKTVLLIEDERDLSGFMKIVLERAGVIVKIAGNGRDALDLLAAGALPDLILFDLKMPVMDGRTFVAEYRRLYGDATVPLVVMTAADDAARRARETGVTDWLAKPFGIGELRSMLRRHLD